MARPGTSPCRLGTARGTAAFSFILFDAQGQAEPPLQLAIVVVFPCMRAPLPRLVLDALVQSRPPRPRHRPRYPETVADTPVIGYIDDDPSLLPEQPDDGAQESDTTVDDDPYFTEGAYYYVQAANDQE
ncbi:uncharacterized protein LOC119281473 [Triticum dicoccoides]|uniref:uncharacterized protein LOC119281473 n=1 Tax=Triticum dicoccoides TaxID=85692 RepID=UPI00189036BA|nr:uncharacterized protein LOC119281473 [Triticum dicoccoides]